MKKTMTTLLLVLVSVCMIFCLSACGSSDNDTVSATDTDTDAIASYTAETGSQTMEASEPMINWDGVNYSSESAGRASAAGRSVQESMSGVQNMNLDF